MAADTVAEQIRDMLEENWALLGALAVANMEFSVGWYNSRMPNKPQITVRHSFAGPMKYFGATEDNIHLTMMNHSRYVVNCWLEIRSGKSGDIEEDYMEAMRREVVQILNTKRTCFVPPVGLVIPLDFGRALHEWDRVPRILRYEITVMANYFSA